MSAGIRNSISESNPNTKVLLLFCRLTGSSPRLLYPETALNAKEKDLQTQVFALKCTNEAIQGDWLLGRKNIITQQISIGFPFDRQTGLAILNKHDRRFDVAIIVAGHAVIISAC